MKKSYYIKDLIEKEDILEESKKIFKESFLPSDLDSVGI